MGFWSRLFGDHSGVTPNENPPSTPPSVGGGDYTPGDPDGLEIEGEETFSRSLPFPSPSPWDGWPADWSTPTWNGGFQKLVDTAWACLDLNSSILASMPVYRLRIRSNQVMEPLSWMLNPDPEIYSSWYEFAKQLFWDFQLGEAFVLPMSFYETGRPQTFRVIPPWLVTVEMSGGRRVYRLGSLDVTQDILHIRYKSSTDAARGSGPLEASNARMVAAAVLARYATELAETGGRVHEWLHSERQLTRAQAEELRERWLDARVRNPSAPAVLSGGVELHQAQSMSAKDLALLELAQFTESRIATMLGVPAFLVGLPSGGDSMTYSNVSSLFDYHWRSSLRPKAQAVMQALSGWALPRGQSVELNRDDYTRPAFGERVEAYVKLASIGAITVDEIRTMERLLGDASAAALTGGNEL